MVTMGIHGVELLVALLGPDVRLVGAAGARRHYQGLRSEDTGVIALRWGSGVVGTVEILGVSRDESYGVTLHGRDGSSAIVIESGDDPVRQLGYEGTIDAFLSMVRGAPSPVPWGRPGPSSRCWSAPARAPDRAVPVDSRSRPRLRSGP
ncbi:Gfo/Idh/MocA family oxidoreductase [Nonomuraea antimicrobica]